MKFKMAKCPVCNTKYTPDTIDVCSVCGWDLTPYPLTLDGIPQSYQDREQKKLQWARETWLKLQIQSTNIPDLSGLQNQLSQIQSQLKEAILEKEETQDKFQQISKQYDSYKSQVDSQLEELKKNQQVQFEQMYQTLYKDISKGFSNLETSLTQVSSSQDSVVESSSSVSVISSIEKPSVAGMNFNRLEHFLKEEKWQEADVETASLIREMCHLNHYDSLVKADIDHLPIQGIRYIEQLWVEISQANLGFSAQKRVYIETVSYTNSKGKTPHKPSEFNRGIWNDFCLSIGWKEQIIDSYALKGYLSKIVFDQSKESQQFDPKAQKNCGYLPWGYGLVSGTFNDFEAWKGLMLIWKLLEDRSTLK